MAIGDIGFDRIRVFGGDGLEGGVEQAGAGIK